MLKRLRMFTRKYNQKSISSDFNESSSKGYETSISKRKRILSFFSPNPSIPTTISDYQLVEEVGRGAFGVVWLSKSKKTSQVYAIKILEKQTLLKPKQKESIESEIKIMKKLRKKSFILKFYETFSNSKYVFIVIELAEMGDLFNLLLKNGKMSKDQVGYFIIQISAGLNELHQSKIIYRDLKPANVLLTCEGQVRLADFGLSKEVHSFNDYKTGSLCGTVVYLAPEVIRGEDYSFGIDWYALGILTHELYFNTIPIANGDPPENSHQLMKLIMNGELTLDPKLEPEGQSFIYWLTNPISKKRPQNFKQIKLHPWISNLPWKKIILNQIPSPFYLNKHSRIQPNQIHSSSNLYTKFDTNDNISSF
ncbi:kinase-like domain-containing protein [Melampsora americana]|nr:kinase-like domain-containing protein [Melampsora americana]